MDQIKPKNGPAGVVKKEEEKKETTKLLDVVVEKPSRESSGEIPTEITEQVNAV